jgi:hypothetical protein
MAMMTSMISLKREVFESHAEHAGRAKLTHLVIGPGPESNSFDVQIGNGIEIPVNHFCGEAGNLPEAIGICEIIHLKPDVIWPANQVQDALGELGGDLVPHTLQKGLTLGLPNMYRKQEGVLGDLSLNPSHTAANL